MFDQLLQRGRAGWCLLLFVCLLPGAIAAVPAKLAADGKALMPIVISAEASDTLKSVAGELADYLHRITGATFTVQASEGKTGIVLGTLAQFPTPSLSRALEMRNTYDGKEAFAIQTTRDRVLLLGATEMGVSHAAFRFLEALGCRWFFPGKTWEVVPKQPALTAQLDLTDRPVILSRRIWYGYGFFPDTQQRPRTDYQDWARHNRMAMSFSVYCGHAWQSIIADNKAAFEAHQEYLALVKGERKGPQLCVSNPGVQQVATAWALKKLRDNPTFDMVSMECSDGGGQCECENCAKLGSVSDRAFGLANIVAKAVGKEYPGKMVGLYAYNEHCEPPAFALEPNVYVQSTAGFIRGKFSFLQLIDLWPRVCKSMGFYLYFSVWLWDYDMPASGNGGNLAYLKEWIPRLAAKGATSIDCESGDNWGPHGRGYYIANKLMWKPTADVDWLLKDFYTQAFGPAAGAMQQYYDLLDAGSRPLVSETLWGQALRCLQEASRLAAGRPEILARLDDLKAYQHYVRLRWDYLHAGNKAEKERFALAALTHAYRSRFSYMNHWEAIRQSWTSALAKEFNQPSWSATDPTKPKPWATDTLLTHEEIEKDFQDDLTHFVPQTVISRAFSTNLLPALFQTDAPAISTQKYQSGAKYALFSRTGEPLELSITTGVIAWYRDRPAAIYTVTDTAGKEVTTATLPQDGDAHALSIRVPKAGLYWFTFNDQGAAWQITVPVGHLVAIALSRDFRPRHLGSMQRMYFYVPKGTTKVQYFWSGSAHEILGPDGKRLARVTESGKYVECAVPAGSDGKVWSFTGMSLGDLIFSNIPNYLSPSPDALLLPRELVENELRPNGQWH